MTCKQQKAKFNLKICFALRKLPTAKQALGKILIYSRVKWLVPKFSVYNMEEKNSTRYSFLHMLCLSKIVQYVNAVFPIKKLGLITCNIPP